MKKEVKSTNEILENFAFHVNSLMESWFSNESQAIKENDYDIIAQSGAKLLSIAAKSCHFKDEFEASYSLGLLLSSSIISKKTYTAYELNFNMYKGCLSFEAYIGDAEYLKNMQDDFYIEFSLPARSMVLNTTMVMVELPERAFFISLLRVIYSDLSEIIQKK